MNNNHYADVIRYKKNEANIIIGKYDTTPIFSYPRMDVFKKLIYPEINIDFLNFTFVNHSKKIPLKENCMYI